MTGFDCKDCVFDLFNATVLFFVFILDTGMAWTAPHPFNKSCGQSVDIVRLYPVSDVNVVADFTKGDVFKARNLFMAGSPKKNVLSFIVYFPHWPL